MSNSLKPYKMQFQRSDDSTVTWTRFALNQQRAEEDHRNVAEREHLRPIGKPEIDAALNKARGTE